MTIFNSVCIYQSWYTHYLTSIWSNLNRVSNNKHCKYHCGVVSSFGQTNPLTISNGTCKLVSKDSRAASEHRDSKKMLCKFYKNGKCLKGAECRFEHPPICKNFRKNGIKTHNEKGCEPKCKLYHPNTAKPKCYSSHDLTWIAN